MILSITSELLLACKKLLNFNLYCRNIHRMAQRLTELISLMGYDVIDFTISVIFCKCSGTIKSVKMPELLLSIKTEHLNLNVLFA